MCVILIILAKYNICTNIMIIYNINIQYTMCEVM